MSRDVRDMDTDKVQDVDRGVDQFGLKQDSSLGGQQQGLPGAVGGHNDNLGSGTSTQFSGIRDSDINIKNDLGITRPGDFDKFDQQKLSGGFDKTSMNVGLSGGLGTSENIGTDTLGGTDLSNRQQRDIGIGGSQRLDSSSSSSSFGGSGQQQFGSSGRGDVSKEVSGGTFSGGVGSSDSVSGGGASLFQSHGQLNSTTKFPSQDKSGSCPSCNDPMCTCTKRKEDKDSSSFNKGSSNFVGENADLGGVNSNLNTFGSTGVSNVGAVNINEVSPQLNECVSELKSIQNELQACGKGIVSEQTILNLQQRLLDCERKFKQGGSYWGGDQNIQGQEYVNGLFMSCRSLIDRFLAGDNIKGAQRSFGGTTHERTQLGLNESRGDNVSNFSSQQGL